MRRECRKKLTPAELKATDVSREVPARHERAAEAAVKWVVLGKRTPPNL